MKTLAKCSLEDYHQMIEAGILRDRRWELLDGKIFEMSPETPLHYTTAKRGVKYLEDLLSSKADVRFNGPITLSDSEPEPDIAIVRLPESSYNDRHPGSQDIFWIIEIAKTSLKKDLEIKLAIYATAGIEEYWVLDLATKQVIVFRNPQGSQYLEEFRVVQGATTPLAFPDILVSVERLFL
jgi:Uma2 family endonuclease